jgi:bacterioferritin-associated ferredoxin
MSVCICNRIDDKQIAAAAEAGAETAEAAIVAPGAEPVCS